VCFLCAYHKSNIVRRCAERFCDHAICFDAASYQNNPPHKAVQGYDSLNRCDDCNDFMMMAEGEIFEPEEPDIKASELVSAMKEAGSVGKDNMGRG